MYLPRLLVFFVSLKPTAMESANQSSALHHWRVPGTDWIVEWHTSAAVFSCCLYLPLFRTSGYGYWIG